MNLEKLSNLDVTHMRIFTETNRLILREILPTDVDGLFELDNDPEVHRYLGNNPIQTKEQAAEMIAFIRRPPFTP